MKKVLSGITRFCCALLGIVFLAASLGGVLNCFDAKSDLTILRVLVISTIVSFIIGIVLLRTAFKKSKKPLTTQNITAERTEPLSPSIQYIKDGNTISHTDGSPITDEEIPYLIQLGYEEALRAEKESDNPKFHRTEREEELSFNFMMKHESELCPLVDQFEYLYRAAYKTDDLSQRIELLEHALTAFEIAKKFAYSKGKGGTIFFQDMYECMHNSRNGCFSYADIIQDCLDSTIQERDIIIPGILQIVTDNDGILQKNIYEKLPSVSKSDIQREIRKLENEHVLTRTKKSNSYELHIVK